MYVPNRNQFHYLFLTELLALRALRNGRSKVIYIVDLNRVPLFYKSPAKVVYGEDL